MNMHDEATEAMQFEATPYAPLRPIEALGCEAELLVWPPAGWRFKQSGSLGIVICSPALARPTPVRCERP